MEKLIVNYENYRYSDYHPYYHRGVEIEKPENPRFEMGEVVVITSEDGLAIGVVIGVIDESYWDLRTDWAGMVDMDALRSATIEDFSIPGIQFVPRLLLECQQIIAKKSE